MNKKFKKFLTATVISAVSITTIGCSSNNSKLAKNIDKSMANFVNSVNNLDYVETNAKATNKPDTKYGKIIETAAEPQMEESKNNLKVLKSKNDSIQFINSKIDELEIENTITRPTERTDNFKLYILSESPFVTFSSDDNSTFSMNIKFSTDKIQETSSEIENKINTLILKRSILMIYINEIYNGNVNFSEENKVAINAYVNVIKENTSFLNGNRGMVKNQLGLASDLVSKESNDNLVNYYIIKSGEALETRANKLDSSISAIDSIIKIIESSLSESSSFYNSNISSTYDKLVSSFENSNAESKEITKDSSNKDIADTLTNSLKFCCDSKKSEENNMTNTVTPPKSQNLLDTTKSNNTTNNLNNNQQTHQNNNNSSNLNNNPTAQNLPSNTNNLSTPENRQRLSQRQRLNHSKNSRLNHINRRYNGQNKNANTMPQNNNQQNQNSIMPQSNELDKNKIKPQSTNQIENRLDMINPNSNTTNSSTNSVDQNSQNNLVNSTIQNNNLNSNRDKMLRTFFRPNNNQNPVASQPTTNLESKENEATTNKTDENQKIIRAERSPKTLEQDKYTSSNSAETQDNGVIRLPFKRG